MLTALALGPVGYLLAQLAKVIVVVPPILL